MAPCACGSGLPGRMCCCSFDVEEAKTACVMWQHSHSRCTCDDPVCSMSPTHSVALHAKPMRMLGAVIIHLNSIWRLTTEAGIICAGALASYVDGKRVYAVLLADAARVLVQKCKRHKPEGCFTHLPSGEAKLRCPFCLIFPVMCLLHKITNHLELIKGA